VVGAKKVPQKAFREGEPLCADWIFATPATQRARRAWRQAPVLPHLVSGPALSEVQQLLGRLLSPRVESRLGAAIAAAHENIPNALWHELDNGASHSGELLTQNVDVVHRGLQAESLLQP